MFDTTAALILHRRHVPTADFQLLKGTIMTDKVKFPIVGIGASAGGVPALQSLLEAMPIDPSVALVVITHLNPDRESLLHEVLARHTALPVLVAKHGTRIERNHLYVMPSGIALTIQDGCLQSTRIDKTQRQRKPIDIFFASLAEDQGERSIGVVLSGGDGDGTLGAKAIREAGGLTIAQAPSEGGPQSPSMPQSAIESGVVDLAIPVEEMGNRFLAYAKSFETLAALTHTSGTSEKIELESIHRQICSILAKHSGHDFSGYKTKTFFRRVQRRLQVRQLQTLMAYIELLHREPQEVSYLFRDLLINVTNFFRDTQAFAFLECNVVPKLFEGKGANDNRQDLDSRLRYRRRGLFHRDPGSGVHRQNPPRTQGTNLRY